MSLGCVHNPRAVGPCGECVDGVALVLLDSKHIRVSGYVDADGRLYHPWERPSDIIRGAVAALAARQLFTRATPRTA